MIAALADRKPIVIMFSTPGCPFCHALRTEHLEQVAAQQQSLGIHYLELDLSDRRPFEAAAGAIIPPLFRGLANGRELARRLGVRVAPTVVFIGSDGEVAERLVGYGMRDFYAGYLDQRLAEARAKLRS
jgi:thioredoxin-related protein